MSPEESRKLSASLEDYLEAILHLAAESDCARSKDVAELLGVARSSVAGALQLLCEKGLARHEPYGGITLTRQGRTAAEEVARKHDILTSFFVTVLGVEENAAERAACQAEHTLGAEVIGQLLRFMDYLAAGSENGHDIPAGFRRFCAGSSPRSRERAGPE